jgi:hypothetical protein
VSRTDDYTLSLTKHILRGRLDSQLDIIQQAIVARRKTLRQEQITRNRILLTPGTRVKLTTIKPQYLSNQKGTVVDAESAEHLLLRRGNNPDFVPVRLDAGRVRRFGPIVFAPLAAVAKLKDQTAHPDHGYTNQNQDS